MQNSEKIKLAENNYPLFMGFFIAVILLIDSLLIITE